MSNIITIQIIEDQDYEWDEHDLHRVVEAAWNEVTDMLGVLPRHVAVTGSVIASVATVAL